MINKKCGLFHVSELRDAVKGLRNLQFVNEAPSPENDCKFVQNFNDWQPYF